MPSRQILRPAAPGPTPLNHPISPTSTPVTPPHHYNHLVPSVAAAFSFLIALTLCFRKLTHKRTVASPDSKPPRRFSYSALRRATSSFSPSHRLGQGGFGSVYRGALNSINNHRSVAVKVMDASSLQGEREFQNELMLAANFDSSYILFLIGFSSDRKQRRMLLVYELMSNGSLQDSLLHRKSIQLEEWKTRFSIAMDIAKGLEYLHHCCDPAVIHGDIKPSNILLDSDFNAKIGDFGLATLKLEDPNVIEAKKEFINDDNLSVMKETERVITANAFDEFNVATDQSPESFVRVKVGDASPTEGLHKVSVSEGNFDRASVE